MVTGRASLERVRAALERHRSEILERFRATGVGIGRDPDGEYVIRAYLLRGADIPRGPIAVDGVAVRFVVTGPIRPLEE